MTLFKKWFGSAREKNELSLRDVADSLGVEDARVSFDGRRTGTLEGHFLGCALFLQYGEGRVSRCTLTHVELPQCFDLELDPEKKNRKVVALADAFDSPWGVGDAVHLGGGVLCARSGIPAYRHLPAGLRDRLLAEMSASNLVRIHARRTELELQFSADDDRRTSPAQLVSGLSFSMEVCKSRGLQRTTEPRQASMTPLEAATAFASQAQGAKVEDLSGEGLLGIWARVTFTYRDLPLRLTFHRFDVSTCNVWLETRAEGKRGSFGLMQWGGEEAETSDQRFFVSKASYLESERVGAEAARIFSLPAEFQARLVTLAETNRAVVLDEGVLSLHLCDLADFIDRRRTQGGGEAYPLELGVELGQIAEALPVQSKAQATLAESRACHFCDTRYVFSPQTPQCVRCGAPPGAPNVRKERAIMDSPERRKLGEARIAPLRRFAADVSRLATGAVVREEAQEDRIVVLFDLHGAGVSVVLSWSGFSVETRVAGLGGSLDLGAFEDEDDGSKADEWARSARPLFVSKHCRFQSDHSDEELERFVSLPPKVRSQLVALCERYQGGATLEDERFELHLGLDHRHENGDALYAHACEVVEIARAFPPEWDRKAPVRSRAHECAHCQSVVFLPEQGTSCVRCGAPV